MGAVVVALIVMGHRGALVGVLAQAILDVVELAQTIINTLVVVAVWENLDSLLLEPLAVTVVTELPLIGLGLPPITVVGAVAMSVLGQVARGGSAVAVTRQQTLQETTVLMVLVVAEAVELKARQGEPAVMVCLL